MRQNLYKFPATLYRSTKSLDFDGLTDWMAVLVGFVDTFPIRRDWARSVSFWVKSTKNDASREQIMISRWFPHNSFAINEGGWRIYLWNVPSATTRALVFHVCTNFVNGLWIHSNSSFPLNQWVHVCMTYDGSGSVSGLKMYWDGVLQNTTTIFGTWTTNAINSNAYSHLMWGCQYTAWDPLGANPDWPPIITYHFEGLMDETTLWKYELSASEVLQLYNQGYPDEPKQVGLPAGKNCDTHFRMGEYTDGTPFFSGLSVSYGRYPITGTARNAFWNNDGVSPSLRIREDTSP